MVSGSITSVLIVDEHEEARRALVSRLRREESIRVAGEIGRPDEALAALRQYNPQVVVFDIHMQRADPLQICSQLTAARPDVPVIIYTSYLDQQQWNRCLRAGATAHILKDTDLEKLVTTIRRLASRRAARRPSAD